MSNLIQKWLCRWFAPKEDIKGIVKRIGFSGLQAWLPENPTDTTHVHSHTNE